jgi:hypothetical protein
MGISPTSSTVQWFMRPDRTLGSLPVALELGVEVSGTRAGVAAGTRELFSENTKTTLVFEDGAVVRLSAPVEVGQLLFLKNAESQQEIVARVLRQRSFGTAGGAYVELEFTEAEPRFWGEMPVVEEEELPGPAARELAAATQFLAEQAAEKHAAPPAARLDDGEVTRLRDEIAALRQQMSSLLDTGGKTSAVVAPRPDLAAKLFAVAASESGEPRDAGDSRGGSHKESVADEFFGAAAPGEHVAGGAEEVAEKNPVAASATPPWAALRFAGATVLILTLLGAAYYEGFFRNLPGEWKFATKSVSDLVFHRGALNAAPRPAVRTAGGAMSKSVPAAAGTPTPDDAAATGGTAGSSAFADKAIDGNEARVASPDEAAERRRDTGPSKKDNPREVAAGSTLTGNPGTSGTAEGADESIVPPTLLKAANPVAPPEAVRDFVTGDVKCDALVDAKGKVASANVISGPAPLRTAAIEALRLYQYKPATKNGKAVSAHVEVTLKFWYEP